ncbi:hypothetical protein SAXI111661_12105 [Saccharomonospora xinjiangensis]|uniref:hypothetical protein n=1 Tax=Saccharomonospora xinjiangensis TaxID=75294 RepID=UPI0010C4D587|nr:hypothetical protein [Saccharomonospora xinjiangensis]QBQ58608.1 hypothetical protein EYD13_01105 [Saccharomonospora xinjiangensis]
MAESARVRRLTDYERRRMREYRPRGGDSLLRVRQELFSTKRVVIVLYSSRGLPVPEIARVISTDEDYVRYVISTFNERGLAALGLPPDTRRGWKNPRNRRKLARWLAGLVAVAALVVGFRHGLWDSIVHWWRRGEAAGQETLWGLPMLWWGRIGKFLQFAAGLAALLDIYGPERLARLANRTARRARSARKMIRLARIGRRGYHREEHLRTALHHDLGQAARDDPPPGDGEVELGPFEHSFARHPGYAELLAKLHHTYEGKSLCDTCVEKVVATSPYTAAGGGRKRLWDCEHGALAFHTHVEDFLHWNLSPDERVARRMLDQSTFRLFSFVFASMLLSMAPAVLFWELLGAQLLGMLLSTGIMMLIMLSGIASSYGYSEAHGAFRSFLSRTFAAMSPSALPILFAAGGWRIVSIVLAGVVRLLDHPSPGRPLRKLAFLLFLVGFFLDVLAS